MRARGRSGRVGGKALGRLQRRGVGGHQRRQRTAAAAAAAAGAWCWIDRWGREGVAGAGTGTAQAAACCPCPLPLLLLVGVSLPLLLPLRAPHPHHLPLRSSCEPPSAPRFRAASAVASLGIWTRRGPSDRECLLLGCRFRERCCRCFVLLPAAAAELCFGGAVEW